MGKRDNVKDPKKEQNKTAVEIKAEEVIKNATPGEKTTPLGLTDNEEDPAETSSKPTPSGAPDRSTEAGKAEAKAKARATRSAKDKKRKEAGRNTGRGARGPTDKIIYPSQKMIEGSVNNFISIARQFKTKGVKRKTFGQWYPNLDDH